MRKDKPKGKEIVEKRKKVKLDMDRAIEGMKKGKKIKFTPAILPQLNSVEELEDGQVIGVLENEIEGDETGLPIGKHNIFIAKIDGEWQGFAESDGEIVAEIKKIKIEKHHWGEKKKEKPKFKEEGWCLFEICLVSVWIFCLVSIGVMCF
jgi:hypothetical protein